MAPRRLKLIACLVLVLATLTVYGELRHNQFINLDDDSYITGNAAVQGGLSLPGITWAFTTGQRGYWIPLTWLSHMLDCQLFGINPGGHHLVSLLFHIANTLLLFGFFLRATGALGPSFVVAALFAWHPLHVESVAWAAERKDVLSTLFWLLTMWAYLRYVELPSLRRYLVVPACFTLGLMAKPMVVTLPLVLLLLDYWPLGRWPLKGATGGGPKSPPDRKSGKGAPLKRLVGEKVPLLVLAAISGLITVYGQQKAGSVEYFEFLPLTSRVANALVSYISYMAKMVWPLNLAVFYPHPGNTIPLWQPLGAALILAGLSLLCIRQSRRHPYLLVGWLWYLGTLVPVIGLVQAGEQALADRFTYVPLIGLFIILAWGAADLTAGWRRQRVILAGGAGVMLVALLGLTWQQVGYWRDAGSVFEHAVKVTENNHLAYTNLIAAYDEQGRPDDAAAMFGKVMAIKPNYPFAYNNLGVALANRGKIAEALPLFEKAVQLRPDFVRAYNNLGMAYDHNDRLGEAVAAYQKAIQLDPYFAEAYNNLGIDYANQGNHAAALAMFQRAIRINPNFSEAYNNLGLALASQGDVAGGVAMVQKALRINPDNARAQEMLRMLKEAEGRD